MRPGGKTVGQQLRKGHGLEAGVMDQVDYKVIGAEFPHHLAADAAGREGAGDDSVLAAADGDGGKIPVAVVDRLEEGGAFGADRGGVGSVFHVAALIDGAVGAEQGGSHLVAGVGRVGVGHGLLGKVT